MDEIHVHKTKKSICAHFAESPYCLRDITKLFYVAIMLVKLNQNYLIFHQIGLLTNLSCQILTYLTVGISLID